MIFLYTVRAERQWSDGPCVCKYLKSPMYFQYNYSKTFVQLLYSLFYDFVSVEAVSKCVKVSVRSRRRDS